MSKCIRYFVDVNSLNSGVPVDELEKKDLKELPSNFGAEETSVWFKKNSKLFKGKDNAK